MATELQTIDSQLDPTADEFEPVLDELEQALGSRPSAVQGYHHARFHDPSVVYHVLWRTFQGRMLLTPCDELNDIAAGVIARAQQVYKDTRLYSLAFLSNHCHMMLRGPADQIPGFIGFIKRELSRRWGDAAGWPDSLWSKTYHSTALPTAESQQRCFAYVLSQGVKEGLIATPEQWPGIHIAHQVIEGRQLRGRWLNGTAYAKALFRDRERKASKGVTRADFMEELIVRVDSLPCWEGLTVEQVAEEISTMRKRIIEEGEQHRAGHPVMKTALLRRRRFDERRELPPPPWWENRRRLVCWSSPKDLHTRDYLRCYWEFQQGFRRASETWLRGIDVACFPAASFRPGRFEIHSPAQLVQAA